MKKGVLAALVVAALAFGGWYFLSPSLAMSGLKEAVVAGDKEELKERVDFPAIRESLKSQLRARMVAEMTKQKDGNPFAALGMAMANAFIDPLIDGIVSPDGIKALVENGKMKNPKGKGEAQAGEKPADWEIERRGLSTFIARPVVKEGEKAPSMVFKRDGLGWDLIDIEIPADAGEHSDVGGV